MLIIAYEPKHSVKYTWIEIHDQTIFMIDLRDPKSTWSWRAKNLHICIQNLNSMDN